MRSQLHSRHSSARALAAAAALVALAGGVAACSDDSTGGDAGSSAASSAGSSAASSPSAPSSAAEHHDHKGVEVHDAWVKTVTAEQKMTGVFGLIHNHGTTDAHIVSATASVPARVELHETVSKDNAMTMQPAADGFRIPAGGQLELKPGGNHVMLMDLTAPITPGQAITVTLTAEDGTKTEFTAQARAFAGGNESYQGGAHDGAQPDTAQPGTGSATGSDTEGSAEHHHG